MKAAVIHAPDQVPVYEDFADPTPAAGEQLVEVVAAPLHHLTRGVATGKHYSSSGKFPAIPGVDGVARRADGTLIYFGFLAPPYGTFAERAATRGGVPLPAGLEPVKAAGMMNAAASSWNALTHRAPLTGGETVMVIGANGASGRVALQLAKKFGASRVVAVGRRLEAIEGLGADHAIASADGAALVAEIKRGVDVVLDYVWGAAGRGVLDAIMAAKTGKRLRYVSIGTLAGPAEFPMELVRATPTEFLGSGLGSVTPAQWQGEIRRILAALPELSLPIDTFPLRDISTAWRRDGGNRIVITTS